MRRSWDNFVGPALALLRPAVIVEVGSSQGNNTRKLLEFCRETGAVLHAVDPVPQFDVEGWEEEFGRHFVMERRRSHEAIPVMPAADAYLIDGDHNWYTVYHELKLIDRVAGEAGRPLPLVLLHDIGWPYGRRDLYYDPADIPEAFRQPYRRDGIVPGVGGLRSNGLNTDLCNAVAEGGARNGVLTGVEDFLAERAEPVELVTLYGFHDMGVLLSPGVVAARPELAAFVGETAGHHRALAGHLRALEADRIRNILKAERLKRRQERQRRRGGEDGAAEGAEGTGRANAGESGDGARRLVGAMSKRAAGIGTGIGVGSESGIGIGSGSGVGSGSGAEGAGRGGEGSGEAAGVAVGADVVVCVHDAAAEVGRCLASVARHTAGRHRVILVDDGSGEEARRVLADFAAGRPGTLLLRGEEATGFTRAANRGLRAATGELAVLLNSDTEVTAGWLEGLLECAASDGRIGLVGPLTNRGAHQSIPKLPYRNATPGPKGNPLPAGWTADAVAGVVAAASRRDFPRVPLLDGFCLGVTRRVIEAIGLLDEEAFPQGYGETYDYCFRAVAAEFTLAVADHVYIYHAGARSYSEERRRVLGDETGARLREKWGRPRFKEARDFFVAEPALGAIRAAVERSLQGAPPAVSA